MQSHQCILRRKFHKEDSGVQISAFECCFIVIIFIVLLQGKSCGQCGYTSPCTGCELPKVGNISFRYRTSLAISYTDLSVELLSSIEPTDMAIEEHSFGTSSWVTPGEPNYDIHDCLRAFSEM